MVLTIPLDEVELDRIHFTITASLPSNITKQKRRPGLIFTVSSATSECIDQHDVRVTPVSTTRLPQDGHPRFDISLQQFVLCFRVGRVLPFLQVIVG
jgi:hypothetical protein